jgi:ribosome-associated protein
LFGKYSQLILANLKNLTFELKEEYIDLIKLLKATSIAESGSNAKDLVNDGLVKVNGEVESRMRRKIYVDYQIECEGFLIKTV